MHYNQRNNKCKQWNRNNKDMLNVGTFKVHFYKTSLLSLYGIRLKKFELSLHDLYGSATYSSKSNQGVSKNGKA